VEVNGEPVAFRSLSRAEAMQLQDLRGREDEAEVLILSWATGCTPEEASAFRDSTPAKEAGKLTDAILIFSGLASDDGDPKGDTSEPS
jgi:hypothetical protein